MALIKCPECGREVSDKAWQCVHCGYPIGEAEKHTGLCDEIDNKQSVSSGSVLSNGDSSEEKNYVSEKAEYKTPQQNLPHNNKRKSDYIWVGIVLALAIAVVALIVIALTPVAESPDSGSKASIAEIDSGSKASIAEITNGIRLGMTFREVMDGASKANTPENEFCVIKTTIAEQPNTNVYFTFIDDINSYDSTTSTGSREDIAEFIPKGMQMDYAFYMMKNGFEEPLKIDDERANQIMVQAYATFTSDLKYSTAVETFDAVEDYLNKKYGETRYTSKLGESLPEVYGYKYAPSVVFRGTGIKCSVPYYSHRAIDLNNGNYMIVDHHIVTYEEKNTFSHRLSFTLIPQPLK